MSLHSTLCFCPPTYSVVQLHARCGFAREHSPHTAHYSYAQALRQGMVCLWFVYCCNKIDYVCVVLLDLMFLCCVIRCTNIVLYNIFFSPLSFTYYVFLFYPSHTQALQAEQEHQLQQALALEKDTMSQCYSTNYNKLLNAITLNRAVGNSRHHLHPHYDPVTQTVQSNTSGKYSGNYSSPHTPTHGGHSSQHSDTQSEHGAGSPRVSRRISQPLRRGSAASSHSHTPVNPHYPQHSAHPTHSAHSHANAHLSVKHADLRKALAHTLNDYPTGEESDTICTILAANPHISVIVDQAVKLAAGTELLTIIVGPKVKVRVWFVGFYYLKLHLS